MDDNLNQFSNPKHRQQWRSTLTTYAAPFWDKPLAAITTDDLLGVLKLIWTTKPETASRVRGRIERMLDAASAAGLRTGDNPARWKGHLSNLLPKASKTARGHHAALPWKNLPKFITELRDREGLAARALEFTILTASISSNITAIYTSISRIKLLEASKRCVCLLVQTLHSTRATKQGCRLTPHSRAQCAPRHSTFGRHILSDTAAFTPTLQAAQLYTGREVATLFRVHVSTLYAWMREGSFPKPLRVGPRTVRWSGQQLQDYIQNFVCGPVA
ncbi:MAG: helix-turn-helix domain-containing protein [Celeribacter sp.]|jgi:predicted DNA-binding transcriptional regulator AlpA